VQGESPAHRITEVRPATAGLCQKVCALDEIAPKRRRVSVAGSVEQQQSMILGEILGERTPAGHGLGESVDHDDRRTIPAHG
jgi:hypothetical protein